jgi:bacterioferritin-associated ferredoxin
MIVCSCNLICDDKIRAAIAAIRARDPKAPIAVAAIYSEMGCRPDCRGCLPQFKRRVGEILGADPADIRPGDPASQTHRPRRPNRLASPTAVG